MNSRRAPTRYSNKSARVPRPWHSGVAARRPRAAAGHAGGRDLQAPGGDYVALNQNRSSPGSAGGYLLYPRRFEHQRLATNLTPLISAYGVWLIAGMIALESVGVPVPGETVLVAAAIYAGSTHHLHIASVIGAGIVGAIVGNIVAFLVGRVYGYRLLRRYGSYLHLNKSRIKIGQYLFLRHGGKVVFFARFVAVLRSVAGILAGANRMPWPRSLSV